MTNGRALWQRLRQFQDASGVFTQHETFRVVADVGGDDLAHLRSMVHQRNVALLHGSPQSSPFCELILTPQPSLIPASQVPSSD